MSLSSSDRKATYDDGRYLIRGVLGHGAHATVYEAFDIELEERVALKVLNLTIAQPDLARALFDKEVESLSRFKHRVIVKLKRAFQDSQTGVFCIVLEQVPRAVPLLDLIRSVERGESSPQSVDWSLKALESLIEGLEQAHLKSVVHRDLNLKNILVGRDGDHTFVKLVDFGIAKLLDQFGVTHVSLPHFRTYPFVSPEQGLNRDVRAESDYFVFGLVAASLLTWQVPDHDHVLEPAEVRDLLGPLTQYVQDGHHAQQLSALIERLTDPDPKKRPRPATVKRVLHEVRLGLSRRPELKVRMPTGIQERIIASGFTSVDAFLNDLNQGTLARYRSAERNGKRSVTVYFFGRSAWALTTTDSKRGNEEQLVVVDAGKNDPDEHRRRSRGAPHCPYQLAEGVGNGYEAMNDIFNRTKESVGLRELEQRRRDFFKAASFVLSMLEQRARNITLLYENVNAQAVDDAIQVTVSGVSEGDAEGEHEVVRSVDEALDVLTNLDDSSRFTARVEQHRERTVGRFLAFNPETRVLTIRKQGRGSLPDTGYLSCVDHGTLTSIRRQRKALNRFIKDDTVNPRLGDLILNPKENSRGLKPLINLSQVLEPHDDVREIVEDALAARDFYFVQGPPGTGKTTLNVELMTQILARDKRARILSTAQPNEAIAHVFEKFRKHTGNKYRDLLLTKGSDELSSNFGSWVQTVAERSQKAADTNPLGIPENNMENVREVLTTWRERLPKTADVMYNYARSVQVFGATCLKVPYLTQLADDLTFDYIIVDESAKALDTEVLAALVEGKRFILVGDHFQLPPHLDVEMQTELERAGFDSTEVKRSLFERLFNDLPSSNKTTFRRQFRMHHSIGSDFIGPLFYDEVGGLDTGVKDQEREFPIPLMARFKHRVLWFDVHGAERKARSTYYNQQEAEKIAALLREINKQLRHQELVYTASVITPYLAQVEKLREALVPETLLWTNLKLSVATVDSFQGKESDISVFSLVRTSGKMRFAADKQRLNVSLSRGRRALFIFGNLEAARTNDLLDKAVRLLPQTNIIKGQR